MIRNPRALIVIAIVAVIMPLSRFFSSPSFEAIRAVDMVLLFVAGVATGALLANILGRKSSENA